MLSGERIVCFAPDPWSDIWRNRHRLLSIFARTNRVLYVEPRTTVRSLGRGLRAGELKYRDIFRPRVEEVRENLFVYHDPIHLPRMRRGIVGPAVEWMRNASFRRALLRVGFEKPILWLVRPESYDVVGKLDEKLLLYQIVDDYLSYAGVTERARERLDREERFIASRADVVIATAEHLLEIKRHLHSNIVLVRNGVDDRTLEEGRRADGKIAPELVGAKRPLYGYVGGITEKLDLALLESIAAKLGSSGGTLALVGPVNVGLGEPLRRIERLRASSNVILTGAKPAEEVPAYLRAFDVGLIPYKAGPQASSIDPLKLYEYLAFGKPIVSIDIPSVRTFEEVVQIAKGPEDYIRLLAVAATESDASLASRRRALATENSWEKRAEQISTAIEQN